MHLVSTLTLSLLDAEKCTICLALFGGFEFSKNQNKPKSFISMSLISADWDTISKN